MVCKGWIETLEDYLDGYLESAEQQSVETHLQGCEGCRAWLAGERQLRARLSALETPGPSPDFADRVLHAAVQGQGRDRVPRHGGAAALACAMLLVGILIGVGLPLDRAESPSVAVQEQPKPPSEPQLRTVKLAFAAGRELKDVQLTLELPPHVEVASFPGHHRLSWQVDLDKGENLLSLPLKVLYPAEGEIIARLEHGGERKVFRTPLPVNGGPSS